MGPDSAEGNMKKNEALSMARKKWAIKFDNFINNIDVVNPECRERHYWHAASYIMNMWYSPDAIIAARKANKQKEVDNLAWWNFMTEALISKWKTRTIDLGTRKIEINMQTGYWWIGDKCFYDKEEVLNFLTHEEQVKLFFCPAFHKL